MAYVMKEGNGTLFNNDRKKTENHPDLNGSIMINGVERWFSGWKKQGQNGEFISVSIGDEKKAKPAGDGPAKVGNNSMAGDDFSDDIPF